MAKCEWPGVKVAPDHLPACDWLSCSIDTSSQLGTQPRADRLPGAEASVGQLVACPLRKKCKLLPASPLPASRPRARAPPLWLPPSPPPPPFDAPGARRFAGVPTALEESPQVPAAVGAGADAIYNTHLGVGCEVAPPRQGCAQRRTNRRAQWRLLHKEHIGLLP
jgi:hypothetical protein